MQHRIAADAHSLADHGERPDRGALPDGRRLRYESQRMNAGRGPRRLIEKFQRAREIQVWIARYQPGQPGGAADLALRLGYQDGARPRVLDLVRILGVRQKGQFAGTGVLHAGNSRDFDLTAARQFAIQPGGDFA